MNRLFLTFLLAALLLENSVGCTLLAPHIHDLALVSIEIVPPRVVRATGKPRDHVPQLKVTVSTNADLIDIADPKHFARLSVYAVVSTCRNDAVDDKSMLYSAPGVFWQGGDVDNNRAYFEEDDSSHASPEIRHIFMQDRPRKYWFFVSIRYTRDWSGDMVGTSYNLEQRPEDICLAVAGGDMAGVYYRTNSVVIPKAAIVEAFQRAARQQ